LDLHHYSLSQYREFFKQADLPLEVKRVNLSKGVRYYFGQMVNGLTHARYAFIGSKLTRKNSNTPSLTLRIQRG
jgi:hypothetical protein